VCGRFTFTKKMLLWKLPIVSTIRWDRIRCFLQPVGLRRNGGCSHKGDLPRTLRAGTNYLLCRNEVYSICFRVWVPGFLIRLFLTPVAKRINLQDPKIVKLQTTNIQKFGGEKYINPHYFLLSADSNMNDSISSTRNSESSA